MARSVRDLVHRAWSRARRTLRAPRAVKPRFDYQALYEAHARNLKGSDVVGDGDFDVVGKAELEILKEAGLRPESALLDFGCGIGRLARWAIPFLTDGSYVGIDISPTMIRRAQELCSPLLGRCRVKWFVQTTSNFALPPESLDMVCAFSVFTHMEHEDSYRYLSDAFRIVKPGGRFLLTCLPIQTPLGRKTFLDSAGVDLAARWTRVRNVATSTDLMVAVAELAGWTVFHSELAREGQSVLVLEKLPGP
jgi:cyclopropane fatty-acyl-phospholipid synthase-like methyltransferase